MVLKLRCFKQISGIITHTQSHIQDLPGVRFTFRRKDVKCMNEKYTRGIFEKELGGIGRAIFWKEEGGSGPSAATITNQDY